MQRTSATNVIYIARTQQSLLPPSAHLPTAFRRPQMRGQSRPRRILHLDWRLWHTSDVLTALSRFALFAQLCLFGLSGLTPRDMILSLYRDNNLDSKTQGWPFTNPTIATAKWASEVPVAALPIPNLRREWNLPIGNLGQSIPGQKIIPSFGSCHRTANWVMFIAPSEEVFPSITMVQSYLF